MKAPALQAAFGSVAIVLLAMGCVALTPKPHQPSDQAHHLEGVPRIDSGIEQCAAASLAAVMHYWGSPISTEELHRELPKADNGGVLSLDVLLAARERGFNSELAVGDRDLIFKSIEAGEPLILMLQIFDAPGNWKDLFHYVVVDGFDTDLGLVRVHFGDGETRWVSLEKISKSWSDTGHATILVTPGERPDGDANVVRYAVALEDAGHLDEAESIYQWILDSGGETALVWLNLGNVRLAKGLRSDAESAYRRSLELDPTQPDALNNLAWLLLESDSNLDQARDLALRAVDLEGPDPHLALETLGRIELALGDCDGAIEAFEAGLAATSAGSNEQGWLLFGLAKAQLGCGQANAARLNLEKASREAEDTALRKEIAAALAAHR